MIVKILTTIFLTLLIAAGTSFAQDKLSSRALRLQEIARESRSGALGCGETSVKFVTSRGEMSATVGLDVPRVFGKAIVVEDLLALLRARVKAVRTGLKNQISAEVTDLISVTLLALQYAEDPAAIPVIEQLLNDKNDMIVTDSLGSLLVLAELRDDLRVEIEKIEFPKKAVQIFKRNGGELKDWMKVKEEN